MLAFIFGNQYALVHIRNCVTYLEVLLVAMLCELLLKIVSDYDGMEEESNATYIQSLESDK